MFLCHLITDTMKRFRAIILLFLMLLVSYESSAQCAMCRAVLESGGGESAAEGINNGIVYLMAFPYLLMAGVAYFIWRSRKKARAED